MKTQIEKRKEALQRLEIQLESGDKTINKKTKRINKYEKIPLTEKDKNRIKKEIEILEAKI